ncbi:hypothetical protein CEXT_628791 [Caerostris extrusa]|uniref:Uncharacterized protein n=1 Tax=Caerostris extrusa TaxID=172846 RepID=A0AAV4P9H2_CAEEX|nr:hypothetical protein CEXT_628791 [Caerostris extrusa]
MSILQVHALTLFWKPNQSWTFAPGEEKKELFCYLPFLSSFFVGSWCRGSRSILLGSLSRSSIVRLIFCAATFQSGSLGFGKVFRRKKKRKQSSIVSSRKLLIF